MDTNDSNNNTTNEINYSNTIIVKPSNYYTNFRNTELLPYTPIINIIENQYSNFKSNNSSETRISLYDLFEIEYKGSLQPIKGLFNGVNIKNRNSFSLEKLICYLIYTKSSYFLEEKSENSYQFNLSYLKSQIGKDIVRISLFVNKMRENIYSMKGGNSTPNPDTSTSETYNISNRIQFSTPEESKEEQQEEKQTTPVTINNVNKEKEINYFGITDKYLELVIENDPGEMIDNEKYINYNLLNEIGILSCQNIFNLIAELIQIEINNITKNLLKDNYLLISPTSRFDSNEKLTISNEKTININIYSKEKEVSIYFDSYLYTSSEFVAVGRISFILTCNLSLNSFQFDKLDIEYDLQNVVSVPEVKYTLSQKARYYGITQPSTYIKKRLFTSKGGKTRKTRKGIKTRKGRKTRKGGKKRKGKKTKKV